RPAREPRDLDFLWANFFVTGEYAPVARILDVFDSPETKENQILLRVARGSLGSNLRQHPRLADLLQKHVKDRPEGSRKVVGELLRALPKQPPPGAGKDPRPGQVPDHAVSWAWGTASGPSPVCGPRVSFTTHRRPG